MNTHFLKHAKVKEAVNRIWIEERSITNNFFTRLRRFNRFYKTFCIRQASESRRQETDSRAALDVAQGALQADPQNVDAQLHLAQMQAHLLTFETRRAEGKRLRSRLKWKSKGDSMSREFFNAVKEKPARSTISELTNPGGASFTSHKDIEDACVSFYKELYSAPSRDVHTRQAE